MELFGLGATADFHLAPAVSFALLDTNGDQRIHESEFAGLLGGLDLIGSQINATLTLDATLGFLDYVDVDPRRPNNAHGGDPFIVRATASLSAQPSQVDLSSFAGLETQWTNLRAEPGRGSKWCARLHTSGFSEEHSAFE